MVDALTYYKSQLLNTSEVPTLNQGDGDSLYNDIVLDAGENNLVLKVTEQQYVELLSAALNGVYVTYPDNWLEVLYPLIKAGKLSFCDEVLSCIQTNEAIQQAIAMYSNTYYPPIDAGEVQSILDSDFVQGQPDCDNDKLFGMTTGLTDLLNQLSEDLLELLVNAPAAIGRLGDLIEAIPGVGELPFDDMLQFAEKLAVQVNNAYQAAYDTQIRDDFRCGLFCIAEPTCSLTIEQARDFFKDQIVASVSDTNFENVVNDILANNWLGEQSIYVMHWLILDTIIFGGEFLGIDHNRILTQVAALFNDPDSDWNILCDCQEWEYTFDFVNVDYSAYWEAIDASYVPVWTDGSWIEGGRDSLGCRNGLYIPLNADTDITFAEAFMTWNNTATNTRNQGLILSSDAVFDQATSPRECESISMPSSSGSFGYECSGDNLNMRSIAILFGSRDGAGSWSRITGLTVQGIGYNPFTSFP